MLVRAKRWLYLDSRAIKRFNLHFIYRLLREWAKGHGGQISDNDGGPLRNLQVQRGTTHLREASLSGTQLSCLEDGSRSRRVLSALSRWKELHNFHYPMMNLALLQRNYPNYSIRIADPAEREKLLFWLLFAQIVHNAIISLSLYFGWLLFTCIVLMSRKGTRDLYRVIASTPRKQ